MFDGSTFPGLTQLDVCNMYQYCRHLQVALEFPTASARGREEWSLRAQTAQLLEMEGGAFRS